MPTLTNDLKTIIDSSDKIKFCNSPIHIRQQAITLGNQIKSVTHFIWIWNTNQNKVLGDSTYTIKKELVSETDTYISVNIGDLIKSWLVSPENARNTNQPQFAWNPYSLPAQTGQGVFYQLISEVLEQVPVTNNIIKQTIVSPTYFATLGYRWNYEQNSSSTNGTTPYKSDPFGKTILRKYNQSIDNYFLNSFNLGQSISACTSGNMIVQTKVTPPANQKYCNQDNYLIVFLNKLGLWDNLTPFGKTIISTKIDTSVSNRMFRDPSYIDNSQVHSSLRDNINIKQTYTINTGHIDETAIQLVEELIYSPKVYLIRFNGDKLTQTISGLTVDNTYVTVDNTNITVDNQTVTSQSIGYFTTFQQIPVVVTGEDFTKKTRLNDKINIEYTIRFDETNNKILSVR
jgi:hypothetical protein